jgi:hypothetical protein
MRPLWIGAAPSRSTSRLGAAPLVGMSGHRLAAWAGLSPADFRSRVELVNLFEALPEKWDVRAARERALDLMQGKFVAGARVVLLGSKVAMAFKRHKAEPFAWETYGLAGDYYAVARMPHPSGENLFWNDPANVRRAERFLRRLLGVMTPRARQARLQLGRSTT